MNEHKWAQCVCGGWICTGPGCGSHIVYKPDLDEQPRPLPCDAVPPVAEARIEQGKMEV